MKIKSLLAAASLIIVVALAVVGHILVPFNLWDRVQIAAFVLLIATIGLLLHPTFGLPKETGVSNAPVFAAIGPVAVYFILLLLWNGFTFVMALSGLNSISYSMMVLGVASFPLLMIYVKIGATIVNNSAMSIAADRKRLEYKLVLEAFASQIESAEAKKQVQKIIEEMNYAASSRDEVVASQDQSIAELVDDFIAKGTRADISAVEAFATQVRAMLAVRQSLLAMHRTKK
jgi:hypothetical protein